MQSGNVKVMLAALEMKERDCSIELGKETIVEVQLEFVCEDACVDEVGAVDRENGRTGRPPAG